MARAKTRPGPFRNSAIEAKAKRMADKLYAHHRLGLEALGSDLSTGKFAAAHGMNENTMRKIKAFARHYTGDELAELCRLRRPNGLPLQWGYIPYLLTISDKEERRRMQQRVIDNGWTAPQLARAVAKEHRAPSGHGRPMKPPATPEAGLEQLMAEAQMWIRRCEVVMLKVEPGSMKPLGCGLRRRAEEAVRVLDKVQKTAEEAARELRARLSGLSSRLKGR